MTLKVGNDLSLWYNTATDASPAWTEINMVGDVTMNFSVGDAEVDLRITDYLLNLPTKYSGSVDIALASDIGGTVYDFLRGFAMAKTIKQYAIANGDPAVSATEYFKVFCHFTEFPWAQPTQEMSNHDASLSWSYKEEAGSLVEPSWTVAP